MIICHLPFPISVNGIWRSRYAGRKAAIYKSEPYQRWIHQAGLEWTTQKQKQPKGIIGPFEAEIILLDSTKRRGDLDNYCKSVLDFAQLHRLIQNDKHCRSLFMKWGNADDAPMGCRLTLKTHQP
jgi:Holliday junction resolvase RusA-like endonuclease